MREVKSNFNPLFTPWCPVWVVFRVSPTPPFLFMSAMPDEPPFLDYTQFPPPAQNSTIKKKTTIN